MQGRVGLDRLDDILHPNVPSRATRLELNIATEFWEDESGNSPSAGTVRMPAPQHGWRVRADGIHTLTVCAEGLETGDAG
jgi:hypothetical protein